MLAEQKRADQLLQEGLSGADQDKINALLDENVASQIVLSALTQMFQGYYDGYREAQRELHKIMINGYMTEGSKQSLKLARQMTKRVTNFARDETKLVDKFTKHWERQRCLRANEGFSEAQISDDLLEIFDTIWNTFISVKGRELTFSQGQIFMMDGKEVKEVLSKRPSKLSKDPNEAYKQGVRALHKKLKR